MSASARSIPLVSTNLPALSPPGGGGVEESRSGAWRSAIGALALALLLWPGAAWAQPAADDEAEAEAQEERDEPEGVEEIVVTGSRIRRDAFTSALPITVITAEDSIVAGLADSAEILQSSSLASGTQIDNTFVGFVTSGGAGANTFGLRGLGADRTLILVNGRRFTPAGVRGQVNNVDLNSIPYVAIERYEILKDGASSVYGADAVAGVVNIITRKQFDELRLNVRRFDKETDAGDISLSWGKTGDRGYVDFAVQYSHQGAIKRSEREWAHCDHRTRTDGGVFPSIFPATSGGRVGAERCFGSYYGTAIAVMRNIGTQFFGYTPEGNFGDANLRFASPGNFEPGNIRIRRNVGNLAYRDDRNSFNQDLIPRESLIQAYSDGERDFDLDRVGWLGPVGDFIGTVTGNFEAYYTRRKNLLTGSYRQFFPDVSTQNPTAMPLGLEALRWRQNALINEFGLSATHPAAAMGTLEDDLPTLQPVVLANNMLSPATEVTVSTYALRGGLKGDLGRFNWSFLAGYSISRGRWTYETWLKDRVARSLSAERNADGRLSCIIDRTQLAAAAGSDEDLADQIINEGPDANCVAIDLFSEDAMLNGRLPQNAVDYISDKVLTNTSYDLVTLNFDVEGALFDLPAGEVRGVLGLEWRSRELDDIPPLAAREDNQWGFTSGSRTKGDDTVSEAYAEIEFPILVGFAIGGISVAEELTFNASGRYTDQSSYGSDTTYRGLLSWAINPIVRLRSAYGTSFRAPSLYEFYLAQQTGFVSGTLDPCNGHDTNTPGSVAYDNCQDLVDQGVIQPDFTSSSLRTLSGGNPDLKAETSKSLTIGLVLTPDLAGWLPVLGLDLSLAVDFYDIKIKQSISRLPSRDILNRCYGSPGLTAPECGLLGPRSMMNGEITSVSTNFINIAAERSTGFDITLRTEREFSFGELTVNMQGSRVISTAYDLTGDALQEQKGHHSTPRWRGEALIRFQRKAWAVNWNIDYIGRTRENPVWCRNGCSNSNPGATNLNIASAAFFHDAFLTYRDPLNRFLVSAGVRNMFNRTPPVLGWRGYDAAEFSTIAYNIPLGAGYDISGRRAYVTVAYNF